MKKILLRSSLCALAAMTIAGKAANAQGWQAVNLNRLIAINKFDNTIGFLGNQVDDIHVGIGTNVPDVSYKAEIYSSTPNSHLGIAGPTPSIRFSNFVDWASSTQQTNIGLASSSGDYVSGSVPGDFVIQNWKNYSMIFANGGAGFGGVERMRISPNGHIGINTGTSESDRLHVLLNPGTEYVRIENMPVSEDKLVVIDPSGRLYKSSLSSAGLGDYWGLFGNNIAAAPTKWLGTTSSNMLHIKTNNIENITVVPASISASGFPNVGINTITAPGGTPSTQYKMQIWGTDGDDHLAISGNHPSIRFSNNKNWLSSPTNASIYGAFFGLATTCGDFVHFATEGDFVMGNRNHNKSIIFGTSTQVVENLVGQGGGERVRIDSTGYFGVNTINNLLTESTTCGQTSTGVYDRVDIFLGTSNYTNTTAFGYTPAMNCFIGTQEYVRIQNMPIGGKYVVTIDDQGRLYRCSQPYSCTPKDLTEPGSAERPAGMDELQKQVDEQKAEIAVLTGKINDLINCCAANKSNSVSTGINSGDDVNTANILYQNTPNPFSKETKIGYLVSNMSSNASIMISDMNGKQFSRFPITQAGSGSVMVPAGNLSAGIYLYTLIVDGNPVDSKKMVVNAD